MSVPVFEIKDVTYEYKDKLEATPALQHISFSIHQGEFLAIVGPNGSGKSTLLKLILGVYKLQQGNILINGKSRKSFNAWQEIGYVSQKAAAHAKGFPATVEEVVLSGLTKEKGLFKRFNKKDNKQLDKTLKLLDIGHIKHQNVSNLSGGQAQRVFIARALINEPSILVLDEPTEGIDSKHVKDFYNVLLKLKEQEVTILLVTHDIGVVVDNADKVACLNEHLHFHGTNKEFQNLGEAELSKIYGFPLQLVSHNHQRECCK
ncbi:metal ABC transporter ATP-binding protein [Jeotgalicoccus halotolerans]|uniref:Zinc transport system ATP-binding protein n=1 Tax=Jeotgalicoccus halotolerans TaxID=157227 RepID=A0A3E0B169_9STAP|nr:metal ABC transporter ATP-binding protein [Jeotgalicoccus halotolerans]REG25710.1 zinc transport system ATP-binding protein [Jeotgalicoccus halotolerans]